MILAQLTVQDQVFLKDSSNLKQSSKKLARPKGRDHTPRVTHNYMTHLDTHQLVLILDILFGEHCESVR